MAFLFSIASIIVLFFGINFLRKPTNHIAHKKSFQWVLGLFLASVIYEVISTLFSNRIIDYLISKDVERVSVWTSYLMSPNRLFQLAAIAILVVTLYRSKK